jgi:hypothetical protein
VRSKLQDIEHTAWFWVCSAKMLLPVCFFDLL